ncbi:uncharacterized protein ACRADG_004815 isoform 2-T5 [Cochliomyia hominivorax]
MDLISSLNYDCLDKIFKMLSLSDRINFALSCQFLYDICTRRLQMDFKSNLTTHFFNTLRAFQVKVLLAILGPYTRKLVIEFPFEEETYVREKVYFKLLQIFCNNVEILKFNGWSVGDDVTKWLSKLKNLKSLSIVNNTDMTGKYICNLHNLQELSLNNCSRIEPQNFEKIFTNLKKLRSLDIRNCHQLTSLHYQQISENLLELQSLQISTTSENFNCLTKLPHLLELEVWRNNILCSPITEKFLQHLAYDQADNLEKLKIVDCASMDSEKTLLISQLKKLKTLHCITNSFTDEMLEHFGELKELEELYVYDCYFISDKSFLTILQNCPKLRNINLGSCNIVSSQISL